MDKEKLIMIHETISNLNKNDLKEAKKTLLNLMNLIEKEMNKKEKRKERHRKMKKALVFIEHVEEHLKEMFKPIDDAKVICKICNKTIDEIYEEYKENKK